MKRRRRPGLRGKITLITAGLSLLGSSILLVLGWILLTNVLSSVPRLPRGSVVIVDGVPVDAQLLSDELSASATRNLLINGAFALLLIVIAIAVLAWAITGRILRPVHEVTATARRFSVESFDQRIKLSGPRDEVAELADTFNEMLDRLQRAFAAQQRFVANASHELRTPLSVIRTELDVTTADPDADVPELRRMAEVAKQATDRAERLIGALLVLARTQAMGLASQELVDLASAVKLAWQTIRKEAESRDLRVTFQLEPVSVLGDPALLERIAGNLLENAVRHNVVNGWIRVVVSRSADQAGLEVASSGQLLTAEMANMLFEPFKRGQVDRTAKDGAGLGLSIVWAAVAAHRGQVWAVPIDSGGLTVTVWLPIAD